MSPSTLFFFIRLFWLFWIPCNSMPISLLISIKKSPRTLDRDYIESVGHFAVCILTEEFIAQVTLCLMTHMENKFWASLTPPPFPSNTRIVAGSWWTRAILNNILIMASNLPVWVFSAGNDKAYILAFAKSFSIQAFCP